MIYAPLTNCLPVSPYALMVTFSLLLTYPYSQRIDKQPSSTFFFFFEALIISGLIKTRSFVFVIFLLTTNIRRLSPICGAAIAAPSSSAWSASLILYKISRIFFDPILLIGTDFAFSLNKWAFLSKISVFIIFYLSRACRGILRL